MYQALGLAVLARIAVTDGDVSRAVELSERALASCEHAITATGAPTIYLSRFIALEAAGRHDDARDALRAGLRRVTRLVANLGEYRASFLSAYECPALLERAREHGLELDRDGAVP